MFVKGDHKNALIFLAKGVLPDYKTQRVWKNESSPVAFPERDA